MADELKWTDDVTDSGFFGAEGGDGAEALDSSVIDLVDDLLAKSPPGRDGLIRVLLGLQEAFDRVSFRVQELVADRFGLSPAQVAGVVSYYPTLSAERRGRLKLDVCTGSGCFLRGGDRIFRQVTREATKRTLADDEPRLAVRQARCLGVCGLGPVVGTDDRIRVIHETDTDDLVESLLGPRSPEGDES